jgi:hypothetical protein
MEQYSAHFPNERTTSVLKIIADFTKGSGQVVGIPVLYSKGPGFQQADRLFSDNLWLLSVMPRKFLGQ